MNWEILLIISLLSEAAHATPVGTLFYSPSEREALVTTRSGTAQSAVFTLNGIIQRGSKKSAAWINGRVVIEESHDAAIPTLIIKRDHVLIEENPIKVSETLDILSGQRGLRLPEDAVRIKP